MNRTNSTHTVSAATEFWEYEEKLSFFFKIQLVLKIFTQPFLFIPLTPLTSTKAASAVHLGGNRGNWQYQMGGADVSHCYVDNLLLLCLERSQVYRKGIYKSLKICNKCLHIEMQ